MPGTARSTSPQEDISQKPPAHSPHKARPKPSAIQRGLDWISKRLGLKKTPEPAHTRRGALVEFEIRYIRQGAAAPRAHYVVEDGIIYLNRDHPQLRSAEREAGIESNTYHMLCFDIAFTEYALAVADYLTWKAAGTHQELDPNALVQQILDRLGRKAAEILEADYRIENLPGK